MRTGRVRPPTDSPGGGSLRGWRSLWDGAELLQQAEPIEAAPELGDLAVGEAIEDDAWHFDLLAGARSG